MHPKMMIAVANEVERQHQNERRTLQLRAQVRADRSQAPSREGAMAGLARRMLAGIGLRPRLS
jgi:hypothetical protein